MQPTVKVNWLIANGVMFSQYIEAMLASWHWNAFRITWWRHQMETFSALLALCAGNSTVTIPRTKASNTELWYFVFLSAPEKSGWVNTREAGDIRRHRAHDNVTLMLALREVNLSMKLLAKRLWYFPCSQVSQLLAELPNYRCIKTPWH